MAGETAGVVKQVKNGSVKDDIDLVPRLVVLTSVGVSLIRCKEEGIPSSERLEGLVRELVKGVSSKYEDHHVISQKTHSFRGYGFIFVNSSTEMDCANV